MALTGITGGMIGSFMNQWLYIIGMACFGALLGLVIWRLGGQHFFLFVLVGGILGALLATHLNGRTVSLLGAATGGAMGGFLAVNLTLFRQHQKKT